MFIDDNNNEKCFRLEDSEWLLFGYQRDAALVQKLRLDGNGIEYDVNCFGSEIALSKGIIL